MSYYKTWMLGLLVMLLAGCSEELLPLNDRQQQADGDKVTVKVGLDVMESNMVTRAMDEISDADRMALAIRLYVFDSDGYLVETTDNLTGRTNDNSLETSKRNQTNFEVELTKSTKERRIHFVAVRLAEGQTFDDVVTVGNPLGTEASVINSMSVSGTQDAYWQRVVLPNGVPAPEGDAEYIEIPELQRVPLIRNFAKFTMTVDLSNFTLTGFVVMNMPVKGSVAPYNTSTGAFEPFYVAEDEKIYNSKTYPEVDATGYDGFLASNDVEYANSEASELDDNAFTTDPKYMYESPNASGSQRGKTYILLKGDYTANGTTYNDRYYKLDVIYHKEEDNTTEFYNILRNFNYAVTLKAVNFEGYASATEAARHPASNNISASVEAQNVNNIADSHNRLFVSKLYFAYTSGGAKPEGTDLTTNDFLFKYRHAEHNQWQNWKVDYSILEGSDDIFNGDITLNDETTAANSFATVNGSTADGWSKVSFTLKEPGDVPQTATIRLYTKDENDLGGGTSETANTLSRDITILLHKPYEMKVECPDLVREQSGTSMEVDLLLPDGINAGLFPLTFYLEPVKKSVYPDAGKDVELPVHVGQTIITGQTYNSFQYERLVTANEYASAKLKNIDGVNYRVIPCYFKTSIDESATTIYASNEYFKTANDDFSNGTTVFQVGATVDITPTEYYGAGNTYITLTFETTDAATITYNVTEGSSSTGNLTYNATSAGTHTLQVPTQTFGGSSYSVTLTGHYVGETTSTTIYGSYDYDENTKIHRHLLHLPHLAFETNIGSQGFDTREYIRVRRNGTVNCGRVFIEANGIWGDPGDRETNAFYNIDTDRNTAAVLEESTLITFTQEGDNNTGWTVSITAGEITQLQKVDQDAGITDLHLVSEEEAATKEATAPTNGLYKKTLTFAAP